MTSEEKQVFEDLLKAHDELVELVKELSINVDLLMDEVFEGDGPGEMDS